MIRLLRADLIRLGRSFSFRLSLMAMLGLSAAFMTMQATAMDYSVPLSRVIFLPMSMYGVTMAAFVSVFVGTDFSDGFIRNKLLTAEHRYNLVVAQIIVSCLACLIVYTTVTVFTAVIGRFFFENNVDQVKLLRFYGIGAGMCLATGCLFSVVTLLCGNKTQAIVWCMALAFGMLFLAMHTNGKLVQPEYKDGALNPNYVSEPRRLVYGILHDLNPCGQAAQLSTWEVGHPIRALICDLVVIAVSSVPGCLLFDRKDIK